MSIIRFSIIGFFTFLFLQACKKESSQNTATGGQRLQGIINTWSDDTIGYIFFQYDSQNRLVEIRDSTNNYDNYINNPFPNSFIEYNSQNKLIKFITGGETDSLIYNNNNQVVKKLYLNSNGYGDTYAYDAEGRLIGDTIGNGVEVYGYWAFTYDDNGDIVQWKEFSETLGIEETISASYNSTNNPFNGNSLGITYYFLLDNSITGNLGLTDNNFILSKHYPVQINYDFIYSTLYNNWDNNYQYDYYPNGLPETVVLFDNTNASSPVEITSTQYFYE